MPRFTAARDADAFTDAQGVRIHYYRWAAAKPRAIVQIEHGLGEYAARYEAVAQALVAAGYTVYAADHRGHGETWREQFDGDTSQLGRLGAGGYRASLADVSRFTGLIRAAEPGTPVVLLGHSMGSIMAQQVVDTRSADYDALVLSGTAYRMPGFMNAGKLNKKHEHLGDTGYEWLSRDADVAAAFRDDPLAFDADVLKLFGVRDGMRLWGRPARKLAKLPLLIMIGADDSLGGETSVRRLAQAYGRSGLTDVSAVVYPGARHELFHELNTAEVLADLVLWLDERFPRDAADADPARGAS